MLYNKNNLAVAKIAAKDDIRPEISGVFFTKDKTAATDGYKLIEVSVDKSYTSQDFPIVNHKKILHNCPPFIIPAEEVKKIKLPANKSLPVVENLAIGGVYPEQVELITTNLESGESRLVKRIQGRFPDYEKIFPQGKPRAEISINGKFLEELLSILSNLDTTHAVKIKFYDNEKPLVLEASNENQKARALLMPLKNL
jgi:DNA polymerase III sliding clamp (beta) subunit (PCNA family)